MRSVCLFGLLAYACLVLQVAAAPALHIGPFTPNFLALALAPLAVRMHAGGVPVWGAVLGLLADCLTSHGLGPNIFAYTFSAWCVDRFARRAESVSIIDIALFWLGSTFGVGMISESLTALRAGSAIPWPELIVRSFGSSVYTLLLGIALAVVWRIGRHVSGMKPAMALR
jgi:rod shape-determining protein MreD